MYATDLIFWPAIMVMIGCNIYFAPRIIGDRIAMQWAVDGKPTWYAPKLVGLWGMVAFALGVRAFIWAASISIPDKVHGAETAVAVFPIIMAASHLYALNKAARSR